MSGLGKVAPEDRVFNLGVIRGLREAAKIARDHIGSDVQRGAARKVAEQIEQAAREREK